MMTSGGPVTTDGFICTWIFAYRAMAGIRWTPVEHSYISVGYKFFGTTAPSWADGTLEFGEVYKHSFVLGIHVDY